MSMGRIKKGWFLAVALGLSGMLLGANLWQSSGSPPQKQNLRNRVSNLRAEDIKVETSAPGLTIVSLMVRNNSLLVSLRNDYHKSITGYKIWNGVGTGYTEYLTGSEESVLQPGEVREEIYPVQVGLEQSGFKLLAVIFDDGSAEGNPKYVEEIRDYRAGMKMQRRHALQLLESIGSGGTASLSEVLEAVKSKISVLSNDEEQKLPRHIKFGIDDERDRLLRQIGMIQETLSVPNKTTQGGNHQNTAKMAEETLVTLVRQYSESLKRL
jgi:hypothetical protein